LKLTKTKMILSQQTGGRTSAMNPKLTKELYTSLVDSGWIIKPGRATLKDISVERLTRVCEAEGYTVELWKKSDTWSENQWIVGKPDESGEVTGARFPHDTRFRDFGGSALFVLRMIAEEKTGGSLGAVCSTPETEAALVDLVFQCLL
jgi:hypothetical protein